MKMDEIIENAKNVVNKLELEINKTPTSTLRDLLTEANIIIQTLNNKMKDHNFYSVGTHVYAVSEHLNKDGNPDYHYAVFPAVIDSIYIDNESVSYELLTPEGCVWGNSVNANMVNTSFDVLIDKLKDIWDKHAEWD